MDEDLLTNVDEYLLGTNPEKSDTDEDGLKDGYEVQQFHTNPLIVDTDGDGLSDGSEVRLGLDPLISDTDQNGTLDSQEIITQILDFSDAPTLQMEDNGAVPQLTIQGAGDFTETTEITDLVDNKVYQVVPGLIGHPINIEPNAAFEQATLSFEIQDSVLIDTDIHDLAIVWYSEETNEINLLETVVDEANHRISAQLEHFSTYMVVDRTILAGAWGSGNPGSHISKGIADINFVLDSTGSMGDYLGDVISNINSFVQHLVNENVNARLGLVEYKDITSDGAGSTLNYGWFNDPDDFKDKVELINASGGGDIPESAVDGIEKGRKIGFRENAAKFIILVTDADYKNGSTSEPTLTMDQVIERLKNQHIITSVITGTDEELTYRNLYTETGGIYANLSSNFSITLDQMVDEISNVVSDSFWIRLTNGTIVPLKADPNLGDRTIDSDEDGIPDLTELGIEKRIPGIGGGELLTAWTFSSNPASPDSDGDNFKDPVDPQPLVKNITLFEQLDRLIVKYNKETKSKSIEDMQKNLKKMDLYTGSITGSYNREFLLSVLVYQQMVLIDAMALSSACTKGCNRNSNDDLINYAKKAYGQDGQITTALLNIATIQAGLGYKNEEQDFAILYGTIIITAILDGMASQVIDDGISSVSAAWKMTPANPKFWTETIPEIKSLTTGIANGEITLSDIQDALGEELSAQFVEPFTYIRNHILDGDMSYDEAKEYGRNLTKVLEAITMARYLGVVAVKVVQKMPKFMESVTELINNEDGFINFSKVRVNNKVRLTSSQLGEKFDEGGVKEVYTYGTKVVGILKTGKSTRYLFEEVEDLMNIKEAGLPAVNAELIRVDGKVAILYDKKYAQGSKAVVKTNDGIVGFVGEGTSPWLNQRSIDDLTRIKQIMIEKNFWINDLQFLIDNNGQIVISDPLDFMRNKEPSVNNKKTIDFLIVAARKNL